MKVSIKFAVACLAAAALFALPAMSAPLYLNSLGTTLIPASAPDFFLV